MRVGLSLIEFLLVSVSVFAPAITAVAAPPPDATINNLNFVYRGEYFFSDKNLSGQRGDTDALANDGLYTNFSNHFGVGYTLPVNLRVFLGGTLAYADSRSWLVQSSQRTMFNTVTAAAQYYKNFGRFLVVPMVQYNHALEEINRHFAEDQFGNIGGRNPNQPDVFTSEAANQFQAGAWIKYPIWKFDTWGYAGYRFQGDDKAHHVITSIGTRFFPGEWFIQGEIINYNKIRDDLFSFNPRIRTATNVNVAGGSLRYNSVNPEWMDGEILVGYRSRDGYELSAGLNHTLTGVNVGYGPTIVAAFSFDMRLGEGKADVGDRISETKPFQPDYEAYDASLFENQSPAAAPATKPAPSKKRQRRP
jgi:hypothetical protein